MNFIYNGTVDYSSDLNGKTFSIAKGAYIIQSSFDKSTWVSFSLEDMHKDQKVYKIKKDTRFKVLSVKNRISSIADKVKKCYVVSEDLHFRFFLNCENIKLIDTRTKEINKALTFLKEGRSFYLKYEDKRKGKVEIVSYSSFYKKLEENYYYNNFKVGLIDD
ncbi:hypothetical protein BIY24_11725 [Halobacteriovorax marinus]|uniref:hypothetical protein n=1 Tax=Halobacteriovorax marinus TaxID=97084 RepID=UPI000BC33F72|nr:hypothetical protein [Halobacteriovorax marinus]ATH08590.1 hypothetical protein BIY24_11725 [Halobacteriovorax marinus]